MGKKRGKRTSRHQQSKRQTFPSLNLTYQELPSPFRGLSETEIIEQLKAFGQESEQQFIVAMEEISNRLLASDPLQLLSMFTYYGLSTPVGTDPELTQDQPILQHHVELLQAFLLQHQQDSFAPRPVMPDHFQVLVEYIQQASRSSHMRRFNALESTMEDKQRQRLRVVETIRGDTHAIRNWGYPQQIMQIATRLFAPLEDRIEARLGVRVASLVEMLVNVGSIIEDRINEHRSLLRPIARARTVRAAVDAYCKSFSFDESTATELLQIAKDRGAHTGRMKSMLLSHSDLRLVDIYTLSLDDFVSAYPTPIDPEVLRSTLNLWAFEFGDLQERNVEHFFMGNPIWHQPLILLNQDEYFLAIPSIVFSFCLELMERVIESHPELYRAYEERRGKFLEERVEQLFTTAMPQAQVYHGSQWHDPVTGRLFENDLLVLIDSYLIVVEAKSGRVPPPARRGAELRLEHTVNELIVAPSIQSKRFADFLQAHPQVHRFQTQSGSINEVDARNVRKILRLNVILEPLGIIHTRSPELRAAGFIPPDVDLAPTLLLTDLDLLFELLEGTCQKVHYLERRTQFEVNAEYVGDEPDLMALYLDTGFNIGQDEFNGTGLWAYGMSKLLDPYFMQQWTRLEVPKPRLRLTKWWADILHRLEEHQMDRWLELGCILLNFSFEDQQEFEQGFMHVQKRVRRPWQSPDQTNSFVLFSGPEERRDALVGVAYKDLSIEQRNQLFENAGGQVLDRDSVDRVIIIGQEVSDPYYPYGVIACIYRPQHE